MEPLYCTEKKNDMKDKHKLKLSGILSSALKHWRTQKLNRRGSTNKQADPKYSEYESFQWQPKTYNLYLQVVGVSQTH